MDETKQFNKPAKFKLDRTCLAAGFQTVDGRPDGRLLAADAVAHLGQSVRGEVERDGLRGSGDGEFKGLTLVHRVQSHLDLLGGWRHLQNGNNCLRLRLVWAI